MIAEKAFERLSLVHRIVVMAALIILFALAGGSAFLVHNARDAISSEVRSSMRLAQSLVTTAMTAQPARVDLSALEAALDDMRHVRLVVVASYATASATAAVPVEPSVPAWVAWLLTPGDLVTEQLLIPFGEHGRGLAIIGDPSDELREIWGDVQVASGFVVGGSLLLLWLVQRAMRVGLRPLARLLVAFEGLKHGHFNSRVDERAAPELREIHRQFNHVAVVLERMVEDNRQLTGALMSVQEEERKALAHDLHDEMAPYLFSIRVATSAARAESSALEMTRRFDEIERGVIHLQTQVRRMLTRLRPHALEALGFQSAIQELLESWRQRMPGIVWRVDFIAALHELDERQMTNLYHVVQEGLTNIARHSQARNARISWQVTTACGVASESRVQLRIEDDGCGFEPAMSRGYGLLGIRERVRRMGGELEISSKPGATCLRIEVPLHALNTGSDAAGVLQGIAPSNL